MRRRSLDLCYVSPPAPRPPRLGPPVLMADEQGRQYYTTDGINRLDVRQVVMEHCRKRERERRFEEI